MVPVLKEEFVTIEYNPMIKLLQIIWKGAVATADFKNVIDFIVTRSEDFHIEYILIDTRAQGVVQQAATDYASEKIAIVFQRGVRQVLFVLPRSGYTQMSVDMFREGIDYHAADARIGYFTTVESALQSIRSSGVTSAA